jgi:hypothetical protein
MRQGYLGLALTLLCAYTITPAEAQTITAGATISYRAAPVNATRQRQ